MGVYEQTMDTLTVRGGRPLCGRVRVGGSKNAALPMLAACLLPAGPTTLRRVPDLTDTRRMRRLLAALGADVTPRGDAVTVDPAGVAAHGVAEPDARLCGTMRGSVCLLGPLLVRCGAVRLAAVGGCDLGPRPIDRHLAGLAALGATVVRGADGGVLLSAGTLRGAAVDLTGPGKRAVPTVTGTINVLCAAVAAEGDSTLAGAAREPEVVAVGRLLIAMGARIDGLGTDTLRVFGTPAMRRSGGVSGDHPAAAVPGDRVEAATWMIAAAATGGRVVIDGLDGPADDQIAAVADVLRGAGVSVRAGGSADRPRVHVSAIPGHAGRGAGGVRAFEVRASAFPGLPTDCLPQLAALAATADGTSLLCDPVFPGRTAHLPRLARFGAGVGRAGETAIVTGGRLTAAKADAPDLRAAAALLIAALAAEGDSELLGAGVLHRGYEGLVGKLDALGADVRPDADDVPAAPGEREARRDWHRGRVGGILGAPVTVLPEQEPCPSPARSFAA